MSRSLATTLAYKIFLIRDMRFKIASQTPSKGRNREVMGDLRKTIMIVVFYYNFTKEKNYFITRYSVRGLKLLL